ncbi:uncharacterized protein N7515_000685 [Penicillium bovifimosum]|uniref:Uncharacterized protein n=1 Tax=Penicillium bovifimosum TaxID=126998 RepID=A0A9W9HFE6_9EURO|nr:uncharacterized protein N7515_000685 [Penicillium bovifimosum]KAJ5146121.1 hypothetical protein N7515_000685 [Penicillium bovifimosum]
MGNADLTVSQLAGFIRDPQIHVAVIWFAGNGLLHVCCFSDLTYFPAGLMTDQSRRNTLPDEPDDRDMGPELHDEDGELGRSQDCIAHDEEGDVVTMVDENHALDRRDGL